MYSIHSRLADLTNVRKDLYDRSDNVSLLKRKPQQDRQCTYKETLRRAYVGTVTVGKSNEYYILCVCVVTVTVGKINEYYIFCVCVSILAHFLRAVLYCQLLPVRLYHIFPHYP
jgi:hypothetical protein